jgi:hypothetical protein
VAVDYKLSATLFLLGIPSQVCSSVISSYFDGVWGGIAFEKANTSVEAIVTSSKLRTGGCSEIKWGM